MMKKTFRWLGALAVVMTCACSLSACGGDDDDDDDNGGGGSSSGLAGWYIRQNKATDIDADNPYYLDTNSYAINTQGELVAYIKWPWSSTVSEQVISGTSIYDSYTVYYIPDNETFIKYTGSIYAENAAAAAGKTLLYKFNHSSLGTMAIYAIRTAYYTYWREDNKLYTTEGGWKIYTITPSGLIPDGSSHVYSKYDPDTTY